MKNSENSVVRLLLAASAGSPAQELQAELTSLGFTVGSLAATPAETLHRAGVESPDLVLMDPFLPIGEGSAGPTALDAAREILNQHGRPVVFILTEGAYVPPEVFQAGAFGCISWRSRGDCLRASIAIFHGRHQQQVMMKEWIARYCALCEIIGAYLVCYIVHADGSLEGESFSDTLLSVLGYSAAELIHDVEWSQVVHPGDHPFVERALGQVLKNETPAPGRVRLLTRDGQLRWVMAHLRPFPDPCDGRVTGVLAVGHDITNLVQEEEARRGLERSLYLSQRLESLGLLAGGVAHEYNNLLTVIMGNAELARLSLPDVSPARESIQQILSASRRAAGLTKQMLDYSGKGRVAVQSVHLSRLIHEMEPLLTAAAPKNCQIRLNLADDLPLVIGDVTQIRQVLLNLVNNGWESMGAEGGVITISTTCRECDRFYLSGGIPSDSLLEGPYVILEVLDTGRGFPPAMRERLFDPFYTTKGAGRGLGLSAVLGIVRGHRGLLKVYGEEGRGAVFKVLLPAAGQQPVDGQPAPSAIPQGNGETILVADDEPTVRHLAQRILESAGFTVLLAADGEDALATFRRHGDRIRLVLLDLTMPRKGGEQTLREMREQGPPVPIVMMSGYHADEVLPHFAEGGISGFIQKPFALDDFLKTITNLLT